MSRPTKFTLFARAERTIAAAATNQFAAARYTATDNDETVVGIHVEICLNPEVLTDNGTSNVAGYARLVVNRAGNVIPTIVQNPVWEDVTTASVMNDEDSGDTWAIVPFAIGTATQTTALTGIGMASNGPIQLVLSPKTKRSLRRGDVIDVEIQYSNGGTGGDQPIQEVVTGTLFLAAA